MLCSHYKVKVDNSNWLLLGRSFFPVVSIYLWTGNIFYSLISKHAPKIQLFPVGSKSHLVWFDHSNRISFRFFLLSFLDSHIPTSRSAAPRSHLTLILAVTSITNMTYTTFSVCSCLCQIYSNIQMDEWDNVKHNAQ